MEEAQICGKKPCMLTNQITVLGKGTFILIKKLATIFRALICKQAKF